MTALNSVPTADDATGAGSALGQPAAHAAEHPDGTAPQSTAELLRRLRREFPDSPLAVRVRALEALRRR